MTSRRLQIVALVRRSLVLSEIIGLRPLGKLPYHFDFDSAELARYGDIVFGATLPGFFMYVSARIVNLSSTYNTMHTANQQPSAIIVGRRLNQWEESKASKIISIVQ